MTIFFDCPSCGQAHVQGRAYQHNIYNEFGVLIQTTFWVECAQCHADLLSSVDPDTLLRFSKEKRNAVISVYVPLVSRALALIGLLLGCFPFIGAGLALIAVLLNRRPGGWRTVSWIGFAWALLVSGGFGVLLLLEQMRGTK